MSDRDAICPACGRRGPWEVLFLRPSPAGGQHQAVGLCGRKRCAEVYEEHRECTSSSR